ncbi:VanZ family protein [Kitasatospora sp. NPDC057198]|uniref:VanZ family protein n=1 Tax=Kitasatospora sp. NPDC057198 TaxID=3346046 RepID=UPI00363EB414
MIEATLSAVPGLFPAFAVLGLLLGAAAYWQARRREWPPVAAVLLGLSLAGELAATLTPTGYSSARVNCTIGSGVWVTVTGTQGLMNIALYAPLAFFGVLVLRRPLTVLAACTVLSAATELCQTALGTGRACDSADFVDNGLGALLGTVAGVLGAWLLRRRLAPVRRDGLHFLTTAGSGLAAVAVVVWLYVPLYRDETGFSGRPSMDDSYQQTEAINEITPRLFGPDTRISTIQRVPDPEGSPGLGLKVSTYGGEFQLEWPSRHLLMSAAADHEVDPGPLTQDQVLEAGADFASVWFAELLPGATPTLEPTGGEGGAYVVTYRRHNADGVLMPMRVDVTVSTSGRVMASAARWDADPQLPHPVVGVEAAEARAVADVPGARADTAFLVAEQVDGQWRPCWAVNLVGAGKDGAAAVGFVDAVTGQVVAHQG